MKNTKICPKCSGTDIVWFDGNTLKTRTENVVHTGTVSSAPIHRYVCCDCGFTEEWVDMYNMYLIRNSKKAKREEE